MFRVKLRGFKWLYQKEYELGLPPPQGQLEQVAAAAAAAAILSSPKLCYCCCFITPIGFTQLIRYTHTL